MQGQNLRNKATDEQYPVPRSGVLAIPPYIPGDAEVEGVDRVVKLSSNESPLGPSPKAMKVLSDMVETASIYPDANAVELRNSIAQKYYINAEQLVCSGGSEEMLHLAARAFIETGDEVLVSQYGFIGHQIAGLSPGGVVVKIPEQNFCVDLDGFANAITEKTKLIFIANPGNPTGTMIPFEEIQSFHRALPKNIVLVLDEAYAEFASGIYGYDSAIELVRQGAENVIVTRTFSKMYGLAGLRIGWAYSSENMASCIGRIRPAFNANAFAQQAAIAAIGDDEFVQEVRALNDAGLDFLISEMVKLGVKTTPSVCNFVLLHFDNFRSISASEIYDQLMKKGVIVRPLGGYGLPNALRVSVGTEEENQIFVNAISKILQAA